MQTLQQLQDNLAVLQAEATQNEANYALMTAQYKKMNNKLATQIKTLQTQIANTPN